MKNRMILAITVMFVFGLLLMSKQTNAQNVKAKDFGAASPLRM